VHVVAIRWRISVEHWRVYATGKQGLARGGHVHANTLSVFEARGVASGVPMQAFRMGGVEAPQAPRGVGVGVGRVHTTS